MLEWQWSERVIPFWKDYAKAAERKGVRLCVEQHGRQAFYNVESFFRLREAVGKNMVYTVALAGHKDKPEAKDVIAVDILDTGDVLVYFKK